MRFRRRESGKRCPALPGRTGGAGFSGIYSVYHGRNYRRLHFSAREIHQSSLIPPLETDAAMGIVPYMHSGEAIPNTLAAKIPAMPSFFSPSEQNIL
jgi:hypothetical protein